MFKAQIGDVFLDSYRTLEAEAQANSDCRQKSHGGMAEASAPASGNSIFALLGFTKEATRERPKSLDGLCKTRQRKEPSEYL